MVDISLYDSHPAYFLFTVQSLTTTALTSLGYILTDLNQRHLVIDHKVIRLTRMAGNEVYYFEDNNTSPIF